MANNLLIELGRIVKTGYKNIYFWGGGFFRKFKDNSFNLIFNKEPFLYIIASVIIFLYFILNSKKFISTISTKQKLLI